MPACPNGAQPKPGTTATSVLLQLTQTAMGDIASHVGGILLELGVQPVLGRMSIANLCALNPDDPGPPSPSDLAATTAFLAPFNAALGGQLYPKWLLSQVQYHYFQNACQCIQPGETIPPRQIVPPPTGEPPYPTDHNSQPINVRIEQNTKFGSDGLYTLYNGVMEVNAQVGDLSWYIRPNFVGTGGVMTHRVSGEGRITLGQFANGANYLHGDLAGVRTNIVSMPTKYKQQGTLIPRLYGVGSFMWLTTDTSTGVDVVAKRESIHFHDQWLEAPRGSFNPTLAYRLMPGASIDVHEIPRSITGAWYGNQGWDERALLELSADVPPADFHDPPFYPKTSRAGRRLWSGHRT